MTMQVMITERSRNTFLVWPTSVPDWAYRMCDGRRFRLACFGGYENAVEIVGETE